MRYSRSRYNNRIASPQDSRRGCLCADEETYSRECCDGELINQGIGSLEGQGSSSYTFVDGSTDVDSQSGDGLSALTCSDITLSGFAVAQNGTVTIPTTDIGTITTTAPASFALVSSDTLRTLTVSIEVPSGYSNTGSVINCTTTATQSLTASLECSDITISGFAVDSTGVVTLPTVDIGTILTTSPASFAVVATNTDRTLTVNIQVPSGYFNSGDTLACTTTATQPPQRNFLFSDIVFSTAFAVSQSGQQDDDQAYPGLAHITAPIAQYSGSSLPMTVVYTGSVTSTGQPGTILGLKYYDLVTTPTSRSCTVSVTVPAGFLNVGQIISGSQTTEQQPCTKTYNIDTQQSTTYTTYSVGDGFGNTYEIRGIKGIDNISSTFYSTSTPTVVSGRTDSPTFTKDAPSYDSTCRHGLLGKTNRSGSYLGASGTDTPQSVTYYIDAHNSDDTLITIPEVGMGIYKASGLLSGEFGVDFTYSDLYQPDGYYTHIGYTFIVTSGVITSITATP
tara:strand:+ start:472 stop:1992 length:1521 start_codon:yes stop_codon:yes gene_type:complete